MATYPRLLGDVRAINRPTETLLITPQGRFRAHPSLYAALPAITRDMDGKHVVGDRAAGTTRAASTSSNEGEALASALAYLTRIGAARMELRARPQHVPDQLLAVADTNRTQTDPYGVCGQLISNGARVTGPIRWASPVVGVLQALGIPVTHVPAPLPPVRLQLGDTVIQLNADSGWFESAVPRVDWAVMAAALSAELIRRYFGLPACDLPEPGHLPGLERWGPGAHPANLGGPQWPTHPQIRSLIEDPTSHLPTGPTGYNKPAMIRPVDSPGVAVPRQVAALLGPIHAPLRWERGDKAHQGAMAHRGVASARCLYPTEFYLWSREGLSYLEPGLDVMRRIRSVPAVATDHAQLLLTTRQSKTSYRYRSYSTFLCAQEAALTLAALDAVAGAAGARLLSAVDVSARGGEGLLEGAFETDERLVATVHLEDLTSLDARAVREQTDLATRRTAGHEIFNSLGLAPDGVDQVLCALAGVETPHVAVYAVVHHEIGGFDPGVYRCSATGVSPVPFTGDATRTLQSLQDAKGWLAPDYGSSFLTVLACATNPATATTDLASLHRALREAAAPIHRAIVQATRLGLAARLYNGTDVSAVTQLTRHNNILPLFQLMIGATRADGTLVCPLSR